jgi:hypothetical protein
MWLQVIITPQSCSIIGFEPKTSLFAAIVARFWSHPACTLGFVKWHQDRIGTKICKHCVIFRCSNLVAEPTSTSHHHPPHMLDSSSKRMSSDSDLGPATLPGRGQAPHRGHVPPLRLPQLESPPGPVPARCWPDFGRFSTSHVTPSGHVTLTRDTLAANVHSK